MIELIEFGDVDVLWCHYSHSGHNTSYSAETDFLLTFYTYTAPTAPKHTLLLEMAFILKIATTRLKENIDKNVFELLKQISMFVNLWNTNLQNCKSCKYLIFYSMTGNQLLGDSE